MASDTTCQRCGVELREASVVGLCDECSRVTSPRKVDGTVDVAQLTVTFNSQDPAAGPTRTLTYDHPRPVLDSGVLDYLRRKHYHDPQRLAAGGYGTVYTATDAVGRRVAVKVLHPHLASELTRSRFETEATALAELNHPGLVRFFHYDPDPDAPFIVAEFAPGGTLATYIRERGVFPPVAAALLMERVARVVQYLHEKRVLHRDLKPSNILFATDPATTPISQLEPKVADFGLAKRLAAVNPHTRTDGAVGGTPEYCAPEQFRGGATTDERSDVYALGATLHMLLTQTPPFVRERDDDYGVKLVEKITTRPVAPLRTLRPGLPDDLSAVCLKCLEKDPNDRYPSAAALADVLGRIARGEVVHERPIGWAGRQWRRLRRTPQWARVVAVAAVVVLTAAVAAAMHFAPLPPRSPRVPSDEVAAHLQSGRGLNLLHEDGTPRYQRRILGQNDLTPHSKIWSAASVYDRDQSLILLTEDPGVDRYRLRVRLSQEKKSRGVKAMNSVVGIVLDYQPQDCGNGVTIHGLTLFGFAEYNPGEQQDGQRRAAFSEMPLLDAPLNDLYPPSADGPNVRIAPTTTDPPIRTFDLTVTPTEVTARVDGGEPARYPRADIATHRVDVDRYAENQLANGTLDPKPITTTLRTRAWTPRKPIGIYARGSWLTVHSFEMEPFPQ